MKGEFRRVSASALTEDAGMPAGWFAISWRWIESKSERRRHHARWYKIASTHGTVYRILRFGGALEVDIRNAQGQIAIDWPAWLALSGYAESPNEPLRLTIEPASKWRFWSLAVSHPDPANQLAGKVALLSLGLGILSAILAVWALQKAYWP